MVFASLSLEQGLQISVSIWNRVYFLSFHSILEHGQGDYFAARIVLQMDIVAVLALDPLHVLIIKHSISHSEVSRVSHFSVWNRVSIFTILSGTG